MTQTDLIYSIVKLCFWGFVVWVLFFPAPAEGAIMIPGALISVSLMVLGTWAACRLFSINQGDE